MKVEVLFKSHRFEEFDTSPQTASEPFRSKGDSGPHGLEPLSRRP